MQVLTFDFHNTLANCDRWFHLEIRDLPWAVVTHLEIETDVPRETVDAAYRALRLAVIESGNEIDATTSVVMVLGDLGFDIAVDDIDAAIDALMLLAIEEMEPVPGAADSVRQLHSAGVRMGVVSSAVHHQTLEWILDRMEIRDCFEAVVTSASSGYYKSTPAIYGSALALLGGDLEQSVHVGDSLRWDVATSQKAGMSGVWLQTPRREAFATTPLDVTPVLTLETMVGAAPLLLELLDTVANQ